MDIIQADILKILLAIALGGVIGLEREFRDKAAGFRTIIFICVGATLFTILSLRIAALSGTDPARIAANIVTGVGFLGAGVLIRNEGRIIGLTTASIVWLTSAVGMAIGSGLYILATVTSVFLFLILWIFPRVEHYINRFRDERIYEITLAGGPEKFEQLDNLFRQCKLNVHSNKRHKSDTEFVYVVDIIGPPKCHDELVETLLKDPQIISFRC